MSDPEYDKLKRLFVEAQDMPAVDRAAFLARACPDDTMRAALESLLAVHDGGGGVFARTVRRLPSEIGGYEITSLLGTGGMGVVYRAEQRQPRREVAIKVPRQGAFTSAVLRRFKHEAEILGRLQHPGIAQVYEAGSFDRGAGAEPFFAMELIDGEMITRYAAARGLGVRERLRLFASVCEAVDHAHRKGVIHRDLKPTNVLVTPEGRTKVLDFGVARLIESDRQISTLQTEVGQLIGTIPYMSPEQINGDTDVVDTLTDVYALGVMLYELLSGELPHELANKPVPEAARIIRDEDPAPLSSINRAFRGDLETIVGKAMAKDGDRRYRSAAALADDLGRFLASEPVTARPPSALYQLRKFARRYRGLVAGITIAIGALVAGSIISTVFAIRANERSRRAEAGTRVLLGTIMQIDTTPIEHTFHAALLDTRARDESNLESVARELIAVYEDGLGRDAPGTVACLNALFELLHDELGQREEAMDLAEATLRRAKRIEPLTHYHVNVVLHAMFNAAYAHAHAGHDARTLELHRDLTELERAHPQPGTYIVPIEWRRHLVTALVAAGRSMSAVTVQEALAEYAETRWGDDSAFTMLAREELAMLHGRPAIDSPATQVGSPAASWPGESSALDTIGDRHGELRNGVGFAPGLVGRRAFALDGIDDFIDFGNRPLFRVGSERALTFVAWVRAMRSSPAHVCGKRVDCGYDSNWYQIYLWPPASFGRWRQVALVVDGNTRYGAIYVDGYLRQDGYGTGYEGNDGSFRIGNSGECTFLFEGLIDEARVYDRVLTPPEIVNLYRSERDGLLRRHR